MTDRIASLERRLAAVEARLRPDATDAEQRDAGGQTPQQTDERTGERTGGAGDADGAAGSGWAETFWALEGVAARSGGASHVLWTGDVVLPTGGRARWQQTADTGDLLERDWSTGAAASIAALGHPVRLQLLQALLRGVSTAAELTEAAGTGTSGQTYHHLRQLVAAGWVRQTGRGRHEVPADRVVPLLVVIGVCT